MSDNRILVIGAHPGSAIHHQVLRQLAYAGANVVVAEDDRRKTLTASQLAAFIFINRHNDDPMISVTPKQRRPWFAAYGMRKKKGKLCHR